MRYYLDCEFNGFGGALISLALVRSDGVSLYIVINDGVQETDEWVYHNVMPIIDDCPVPVVELTRAEASLAVQGLWTDGDSGDGDIHVIADWPDDIKYLCELLITGPGTMIAIPGITFEVKRVDAYPTTLEGAVQHNAWWDAMALRHLLEGAA